MQHRRAPFAFEIALSVPRRFPERLRRALRRAARGALDGIPRTVLKAKLRPDVSYTLSLAVVGDDVIHTLNARYRGKDKTTDVLSFSRLEGESIPSPVPEVGDVVIAWQVAKRQAKEYGAPLAEELQRLAVHGILHLFGYDHETNARDAKRMFALQNRILEKI